MSELNNGSSAPYTLRRNSEYPTGTLAAGLAVFPVPTVLIDAVWALERQAADAERLRLVLIEFLRLSAPDASMKP